LARLLASTRACGSALALRQSRRISRRLARACRPAARRGRVQQRPGAGSVASWCSRPAISASAWPRASLPRAA
jgi:hypothetical protein